MWMSLTVFAIALSQQPEASAGARREIRRLHVQRRGRARSRKRLPVPGPTVPQAAGASVRKAVGMTVAGPGGDAAKCSAQHLAAPVHGRRDGRFVRCDDGVRRCCSRCSWWRGPRCRRAPPPRSARSERVARTASTNASRGPPSPAQARAVPSRTASSRGPSNTWRGTTASSGPSARLTTTSCPTRQRTATTPTSWRAGTARPR